MRLYALYEIIVTTLGGSFREIWLPPRSAYELLNRESSGRGAHAAWKGRIRDGRLRMTYSVQIRPCFLCQPLLLPSVFSSRIRHMSAHCVFLASLLPGCISLLFCCGRPAQPRATSALKTSVPAV